MDSSEYDEATQTESDIREMNLQNAVSKIHQIVDQRKRAELASPFFFIVGAGISNPPVKTASEIVTECREIAMDYGITELPASERPGDVYAHWLKSAHPGDRGVQTYLRSIMEDLWISKANLRLAHLLIDGRLAKTVFTPNFDDMLERSIRLFGRTPLVCDHPLTVERMRVTCPDIQIIHVHGSYWFYDCVNDGVDIQARARNAAMLSMLDHFLQEQVPVVVGYSGWEGDIIMTALQRRLERKIPYDIFWFCYRKPSPESYPSWLRDNPQVHFVYLEDTTPDETHASSIRSRRRIVRNHSPPPQAWLMGRLEKLMPCQPKLSSTP